MEEIYIYYKKGLIYKGAPHREQQLTKAECSQLLKNTSAWFLRNTYEFDINTQTSFWFVVKDSFGGMEELNRRTRNKVRHAIANFDIRILSISEIAEQGYYVYRDAFEGYKATTDTIVSKSDFLADLREPGQEFWGAIDKRNGRLAAYAQNYLKAEMCEYYLLKASPDYLTGGYYPFYGLIYRMNEYYLNQLGLRYVSDGSRSATEHSNIQLFLMQMFGFRKAYCRLSLTYAGWLALMVRLLYPFRQYIPVLKVQALLRLEAMSRGDI